MFALVAVSARIFLPADMAAPAPIESTGVSLLPNSASLQSVSLQSAPQLSDS
ncbi:MAG: hypothetical protein HC908_12790 [Calothrix sp. SM1_7_51]|nr:hypothetical protein [Calothrix sp. SM1_7_51]